jgi:hypothetical protein
MTHIINPKITVRQKCIIIGTILGGSSIIMPKKGKNCYLSMRSKDLNWLNFKAKELNNLATKEPIIAEKTYRWHSVCYPIFNEFYEMFYKDKERNLKIETLNLLQDLSIAIWFKDCGNINKNGSITFNTHVWNKNGSEIVCEYFNSLEWKSSVFTERKNYRVKIEEQSAKEVIKMCTDIGL